MKNSIDFRIYYEDTDAGGVVYYANYLKFAERGRTELLRECGFNNSSLWDDPGVGFVVKRLEAEYAKPAKLDDIITVETGVQSVKNGSFIMGQSIFCRNDLIFSLNVTLACIDGNYRVCRIPCTVKKALEDSIDNGQC
jgi:acyl-CoA thioester hydrolase